MATMADLAQRLDRATDALVELGPAVAAGEPWALTDVYGPGPESSWGPREVLAHVAEMLPFWLGELDRIVLDRGHAPVPFGRMADDHLRIGLIERDRTLPLRVLFSGIDAGLHDWELRLASLSTADLAKVGVHVRLGEMPASAIPERFCLGHAEEHVSQLESILAAGGR
jgi:hypothetical protein